VAHVFIDVEFQKLLEKYIPTLDKSNKSLFQSEKGGNVKEKQLLRRLQSLQKKAGIDARGQVFGWHIGRKLFLRTCAELGITSWNAQMLVGKAVDKSISTYINGVQLKNDAMKVHSVLKMEISKTNDAKVTQLEETVNSLEKENMVFKTRLDLLQKQFEKLNTTVEKLYPKEVTRHVLKDNELETWTENFSTPQQYIESEKKFVKRVLSNSKKESSSNDQ
jgi:hypothetical protein